MVLMTDNFLDTRPAAQPGFMFAGMGEPLRTESTLTIFFFFCLSVFSETLCTSVLFSYFTLKTGFLCLFIKLHQGLQMTPQSPSLEDYPLLMTLSC